MTYKEAKSKATKKNQNILFTGDAGNGNRFEVYFCSRRNRQIRSTIFKDGARIN